jgi:hypothetical protein
MYVCKPLKQNTQLRFSLMLNRTLKLLKESQQGEEIAQVSRKWVSKS